MASCQALDELGDEARVEDVQDDVEAASSFSFGDPFQKEI